MKKIFLAIIGIVGLCFIIPALIKPQLQTKTTLANENNIEQNTINEQRNSETYNYKDYNTIKLLHKKTDEIQEISLDEYLYGVVSAEMPANYEKEALKAQAVVARTYTLFKIKNSPNKHKGASICDDSTCCQAWISKDDRLKKWKEDKRDEYWNKIVEAVQSTKGKVIVYDGKLINAFFHANSGGTTEMPINVWGGSGYPYLQVVETSGEDEYKQYKSEITLSFDEVKEKIKEKHANLEVDFSKDDAIRILDYTDSGRVKSVRFGNVELSGVETRQIFGLRSANFSIEKSDNNIKFTVIGYGHGVGMSQTGADTLAKDGMNYESIIKHFYVGVEVINY